MSKSQFTFLKIIAPVAVALLAAPAWSAFATPGELHVVKTKSANLRAGPSKNSKVIDRLVLGDRVMEFERRGHWLKVQQMGTVAPEGWMNESLLEPEAAPTPAVPPGTQTQSGEETGPLYTSPRDTFIIGRRFGPRSLRRHGRLRRGHRHRKQHDGQPHEATRSSPRFSIPPLRSLPNGG